MDSFLQAFKTFVPVLLDLLPDGPVISSEAIATLSTYASYINYFVPVGDYLVFFLTLLNCLIIYHTSGALLRWIKVIS